MEGLDPTLGDRHFVFLRPDRLDPTADEHALSKRS